MVSTRLHPKDFPAPEASPTKGSPRKSRTSTASPAPSSPDLSSSPPPKSLAKRAVSNSMAVANSVADTPTSAGGTWCHSASNLTLIWLAISFPLVIWDCLYILLRPHTMAGGALQWPIWKPYEIYAEIDHVYGWPGWNSNDGFAGAQGFMNGVEIVLYGLYGMIVYSHGVWAESGAGLQVGRGVKGWLSGGVKVEGKKGNRALLIGFSAALMTLSKTLLYCELLAGVAVLFDLD